MPLSSSSSCAPAVRSPTAAEQDGGGRGMLQLSCMQGGQNARPPADQRWQWISIIRVPAVKKLIGHGFGYEFVTTGTCMDNI
jgi:hypothetical protein